MSERVYGKQFSLPYRPGGFLYRPCSIFCEGSLLLSIIILSLFPCINNYHCSMNTSSWMHVATVLCV